MLALSTFVPGPAQGLAENRCSYLENHPISLTLTLAVCLAWVSASPLQSLDDPQMHHSFFQPFPGLSGDMGTCKPTQGLLPTPNTSFVKLLESSA